MGRLAIACNWVTEIRDVMMGAGVAMGLSITCIRRMVRDD